MFCWYLGGGFWLVLLVGREGRVLGLVCCCLWVWWCIVGSCVRGFCR